jgi:hypothetical protein
VGMTDRPNVYTVPFHSLNFNANIRLLTDGKNDRWTIRGKNLQPPQRQKKKKFTSRLMLKINIFHG